MKLDIKLPETLFGIETALFKIVLLPLPLILVFLLSLSWVIIPRIDEINEMNGKIASKESQIKAISSKKNYLLSVNKEELNRDKSNLQSALLDRDKTYFLVGVVRSIADIHGYQVKSFSISPGRLKSGSEVQVASKDVMVKIPISVVLVGTQEKQLELITALESSLPVLTIDQFQISNSQGTTELDLGISAYYMAAGKNAIITNLSLDELKLSKEESELLSKINQFSKISASEAVETSGGEYMKYERPNPFTL